MVKLEEIKHPLDVHDDSLVSSLLDMDEKSKGQQDLKKIAPKWTERPRKFSCHFCMKSFVVKRDWEGHINSIHLKAKPFRCYICSWSSSHRGELQKHVKRCAQMYGHLTDISTAQQSQDPVSDDYWPRKEIFVESMLPFRSAIVLFIMFSHIVFIIISTYSAFPGPFIFSWLLPIK